jgi:diguanylate cyclase (GGDEF)-like protein
MNETPLTPARRQALRLKRARLAAELQRKARFGGRLCVALVDVDHFKQVNDRYGHPAGDEVLRRIAAGMAEQLRSIDQLGRFGGEEFLVLLPGASLEEAAHCAERLRQDVAQRAVLPAAPLRVSISIGLAECSVGEGTEHLLERVDRARYRAKHLGRNRIELDLAEAAQAA